MPAARRYLESGGARAHDGHARPQLARHRLDGPHQLGREDEGGLGKKAPIGVTMISLLTRIVTSVRRASSRPSSGSTRG